MKSITKDTKKASNQTNSYQSYGVEKSNKSRNRLKFDSSLIISSTSNTFKQNKNKIPISSAELTDLIEKVKSRNTENIK